MNNKILAVLLIAGVGCLMFGLVAAPSIDKSAIDSSSHAALLDDSGTAINKSTIKSFHLNLNQKLTIKLFVYINESSTTDDTFHIKIVSANYYAANQSMDPTYAIGLQYRYATLNYPPTSISYGIDANMTVVEGVNYVLEFTGNASTGLKPIPGDFKVILWSEDSALDQTTLYYDLTMELDQLGPMLSMIFTLIGVGLIAVVAIVTVIAKRKR